MIIAWGLFIIGAVFLVLTILAFFDRSGLNEIGLTKSGGLIFFFSLISVFGSAQYLWG